MTFLLQSLSLAVIVVAAISWFSWVRDSWRTIQSPEHLASIDVHGLAEASSAATARSLGVGIAGQLGEHKRLVDYINRTALSAADSDTLHAMIRVSQPAPELIRAPAAPAQALDISVQVAGSKVDATGLQRLFSAADKRGGMNLSVFLNPDGAQEFTGLVSANYADNPIYGFSLPVSGTLSTITEQVAMRFLQAHYSASDPFFAAMDPGDFRNLWSARRAAADIAIRWEGGGRLGSSAIRTEANRAYGNIQGMAARYTARPELQKLAAYFASVGEDYAAAVKHLRAARQKTPDEKDSRWIDQRIVELEADEQNDASVVLAAATSGTSATTDPGTPDQRQFSEPEQAILATPDFEALGFSRFARELLQAGPTRTPVVALILGGVEPFEPFGDRIVPASPQDASTEGFVSRHVEDVASVIATLAPHARVKVYKALNPDGSGQTAAILQTLIRAMNDKPDVVVIPLAPLSRPVLDIVRGSSPLVIAAAGNSGADPALVVGEVPNFIYVGGSEGLAPSSFSNRGDQVFIYAPATAVTYSREGNREMRGTSFSAAVVAATAANYLSVSGEMTAPDLKAQLKASTVSHDGIDVLSPNEYEN